MPRGPGCSGSEGQDEEVARVQLLLSALFLSEDTPGGELLRRAPVEWISEWLGLEPRDHFGPHALRHLVAIQLTPREAIAYEPSNPKPRWRLIDDYLRDRLVLDDRDRTRVARLVATVLDHASAYRGGRLIVPDRARACAICRLPFETEPMSVTTRDPYKPIWLAASELCQPEVDHVIPISSLGEHVRENLQVVCRACNLAKGNGLVVDPDAEIRYAGRPAETIPRVHLFRLLQWLIARHDAQCGLCADESTELTMRPVHSDSPITRANLRLTCYSCIAGA